MRLKADIWVKAYVRRCSVAGAFAAVVRHGDDDAGAIFIRINQLDGTSLLFGPAPAGLDHAADDRLWTRIGAGVATSDADIEARLAREIGIDSDCWIVEVEDRQGRHFLGEDLLSEGG
ncbi:MAG: DUF1491 family protein [Hyphomicrobium sp.]